MPLLAWLYTTIRRKPAPEPLQQHGMAMLIWKVIRKWLCVSVIPFCPFNTLRIWGYRLVGFKIGRKVHIGMQCYLDDVVPSRLRIQSNVTISYRVTFATHGPRMPHDGTLIREGAYIGTGATILGGGIEIGRYATVGACALVTRSIPEFCLATGIPAKVVRRDYVAYASKEPVLQQYLAERRAEGHPLDPQSHTALNTDPPEGETNA